MPPSSPAPAMEKPPKALRMILAFDGEHVHVVSQQSVEMVLPPSDPVQGVEGHRGFWYELRDAQDRALYRRVMHNPMQEDVEGYACLSNRSVRRSEQRLFLLVLVDWSEGSDRAPIQNQWRWRSTR